MAPTLDVIASGTVATSALLKHRLHVLGEEGGVDFRAFYPPDPEKPFDEKEDFADFMDMVGLLSRVALRLFSLASRCGLAPEGRRDNIAIGCYSAFLTEQEFPGDIQKGLDGEFPSEEEVESELGSWQEALEAEALLDDGESETSLSDDEEEPSREIPPELREGIYFIVDESLRVAVKYRLI